MRKLIASAFALSLLSSISWAEEPANTEAVTDGSTKTMPATTEVKEVAKKAAESTSAAVDTQTPEAPKIATITQE